MQTTINRLRTPYLTAGLSKTKNRQKGKSKPLWLPILESKPPNPKSRTRNDEIYPKNPQISESRLNHDHPSFSPYVLLCCRGHILIQKSHGIPMGKTVPKTTVLSQANDPPTQIQRRFTSKWVRQSHQNDGVFRSKPPPM